MASTYTPIATTTGNGTSTKEIVFNTIPSGYTDLRIICNAQVVGGSLLDGFFMQFNGDTATNYSTTSMVGDGTSATSSRTTTSANMSIGTVSGSAIVNTIIDIQNYSNTTTYKTALTRHNNSTFAIYAYVGLWRKTPEAINSIKLFHTNAGAYYFSTSSTFTLYGIKAA